MATQFVQDRQQLQQHLLSLIASRTTPAGAFFRALTAAHDRFTRSLDSQLVTAMAQREAAGCAREYLKFLYLQPDLHARLNHSFPPINVLLLAIKRELAQDPEDRSLEQLAKLFAERELPPVARLSLWFESGLFLYPEGRVMRDWLPASVQHQIPLYGQLYLDPTATGTTLKGEDVLTLLRDHVRFAQSSANTDWRRLLTYLLTVQLPIDHYQYIWNGLAAHELFYYTDTLALTDWLIPTKPGGQKVKLLANLLLPHPTGHWQMTINEHNAKTLVALDQMGYTFRDQLLGQYFDIRHGGGQLKSIIDGLATPTNVVDHFNRLLRVCWWLDGSERVLFGQLLNYWLSPYQLQAPMALGDPNDKAFVPANQWLPISANQWAFEQYMIDRSSERKEMRVGYFPSLIRRYFDLQRLGLTPVGRPESQSYARLLEKFHHLITRRLSAANDCLAMYNRCELAYLIRFSSRLITLPNYLADPRLADLVRTYRLQLIDYGLAYYLLNRAFLGPEFREQSSTRTAGVPELPPAMMSSRQSGIPDQDLLRQISVTAWNAWMSTVTHVLDFKALDTWLVAVVEQTDQALLRLCLYYHYQLIEWLTLSDRGDLLRHLNYYGVWLSHPLLPDQFPLLPTLVFNVGHPQVWAFFRLYETAHQLSELVLDETAINLLIGFRPVLPVDGEDSLAVTADDIPAMAGQLLVGCARPVSPLRIVNTMLDYLVKPIASGLTKYLIMHKWLDVAQLIDCELDKHNPELYEELTELLPSCFCLYVINHDQVTTSCCQRPTHRKCIETWIDNKVKEQRTPTCPFCRSAFVIDEVDLEAG
jgi:hypothetical protein